MLRILQEIKKFDIVYRIREQVRKAAIGLVFCEDDGYISRYRFRAQQGSLSRLSGCDMSFQVPRTCTTDAFVECLVEQADHVGTWASILGSNKIHTLASKVGYDGSFLYLTMYQNVCVSIQ